MADNNPSEPLPEDNDQFLLNQIFGIDAEDNPQPNMEDVLGIAQGSENVEQRNVDERSNNEPTSSQV
jgi:hypothetical protein